MSPCGLTRIRSGTAVKHRPIAIAGLFKLSGRVRHRPSIAVLAPLLLKLSVALGQDTILAPAFSSVALARADSIAVAEFAKDSLGSITIGIVSGPQLVWAKSYGYSDSGRTREATPTTVYRVASISKQLTAVMLLQLIERKRVNLSDPVERYLPEVRAIQGRAPGAPPMTLVQLATMTSGLARDPNDSRRSQTGPASRWVETLISSLSRTSYVQPPGTAYAYSNVGYAILGAALARAAGESYVSYQQRHILDPLGMVSSAFELPSQLRARLATGVDYDVLYKDTLNFADAAEEHRSGLGFRLAAGGLYSTVGDLAKLVALELGYGPENVLRRQTLAIRDRVPVAAGPSLGYGYGLGYQALRWGDTVAIGHSGNLAGYTSMLLYDPTRKFGVIVLRSAAGGEADAGRLAGRVFRSLRSALAK